MGVWIQSKSADLRVRDGQGFDAPMLEVTQHKPVYLIEYDAEFFKDSSDVNVVHGLPPPKDKATKEREKARATRLAEAEERRQLRLVEFNKQKAATQKAHQAKIAAQRKARSDAMAQKADIQNAKAKIMAANRVAVRRVMAERRE